MRAERQQTAAEQDMADIELEMQQRLQGMSPTVQQEYNSLQTEVRHRLGQNCVTVTTRTHISRMVALYYRTVCR
jgi:outer membrane lipopolysaccharide assembly protein LptE/RlpB